MQRAADISRLYKGTALPLRDNLMTREKEMSGIDASIRRAIKEDRLHPRCKADLDRLSLANSSMPDSDIWLDVRAVELYFQVDTSHREREAPPRTRRQEDPHQQAGRQRRSRKPRAEALAAVWQRSAVNLCPGQLVPSNQASPRARTCAWTCWMSLASAWRGDGRAWADCATRHRTPQHRGPSKSRARWFGPGHRQKGTRLPAHATGAHCKTPPRCRFVAIP